MRQMFVGWKKRDGNSYVKAKIIFLCAFISFSFAYLLLENSKKLVRAAGQAAPPPTEEKWVINNSLLKPILRIEGWQTDATETQNLESIFTSSDAAVAAGSPTASNKELFKRQIVATEVDELENFARNHPNSAWIPSLRVRLGQYYHDKKRYSAAYDHLNAVWSNLRGRTSVTPKKRPILPSHI